MRTTKAQLERRTKMLSQMLKDRCDSLDEAIETIACLLCFPGFPRSAKSWATRQLQKLRQERTKPIDLKKL